MIRRGGRSAGRFLGLATLLGVLGLVAGCADESVATDTPDEGANEGVAQEAIVDAPKKGDDASPDVRRMDRMDRKGRADRADRGGDDDRDHAGAPGGHGRGGPLGLLKAALGELELTDAQRVAIEVVGPGSADRQVRIGSSAQTHQPLQQGGLARARPSCDGEPAGRRDGQAD